MPKKYFSQKGLDFYKKLLREQKKKATKASVDLGVANATDGWHENSAFDEALQRTEVEGRRLEDLQNIVDAALVHKPVEQNKIVRIGNTVSYLNKEKKKKKK